MQVFKTFMKVTKKKLHISMIYIVIFVAICVAMTLTSSSTNEFTDSKLDISITDLDNSEASKALADYIARSNKIVDLGEGKDKALDALYYRRADIILTINEGYSEKLVKGETEGLFSDYRIPGSYSAELFDSQLNQYISMVTACTAGGSSLEEACEKAAELSAAEIEVETVSFGKNINADYNDDIAAFFQYLSYILIVTLIAGLCPTLLIMMSRDIRNRTNCSCITVTSQMSQIVLGTVIFVLGLYLLLMGVAAVLFGDMLFNEKGLLAMLNGFVFLIFSMMLTLLIAVIAPSSNVISMIANVISLGLSFLCGVFVPQSLLSGVVLNIGKFLPAYWYVRANNMLAGSNGEIFSSKEFMLCIGIEL
ncbi:MAG: ABC transporter permease, partial [Oscillospiraceae bacterium]|nr:ABC transporter permease [Oscillospiraceae bacterium]